MRPRRTYSEYEGIAMAARIATIATAIISSIRVNPRERVMAILWQATQCKKPLPRGAPSADERGRSQGERRRPVTAIAQSHTL